MILYKVSNIMCTICVSEVALPWSDKVQWASASGWAPLLRPRWIVGGRTDRGLTRGAARPAALRPTPRPTHSPMPSCSVHWKPEECIPKPKRMRMMCLDGFPNDGQKSLSWNVKLMMIRRKKWSKMKPKKFCNLVRYNYFDAGVVYDEEMVQSSWFSVDVE